jgi:hypothetical protein
LHDPSNKIQHTHSILVSPAPSLKLPSKKVIEMVTEEQVLLSACAAKSSKPCECCSFLWFSTADLRPLTEGVLPEQLKQGIPHSPIFLDVHAMVFFLELHPSSLTSLLSRVWSQIISPLVQLIMPMTSMACKSMASLISWTSPRTASINSLSSLSISNSLQDPLIQRTTTSKIIFLMLKSFFHMSSDSMEEFWFIVSTALPDLLLLFWDIWSSSMRSFFSLSIFMSRIVVLLSSYLPIWNYN